MCYLTDSVGSTNQLILLYTIHARSEQTGSLAETVVLAMFQNCVKESMKTAIRSSATLDEALEIATRVEMAE